MSAYGEVYSELRKGDLTNHGMSQNTNSALQAIWGWDMNISNIFSWGGENEHI